MRLAPAPSGLSRRRAAQAIAGAFAAGVLGGQASANDIALTLGTATPGGGFEVYAAALIEALRTRDPALRIEARATKGSTENVPLLEQGALDLGLVTGEVTYEALMGIGRAPAKLSILCATYATAGLFLVLNASPYRTIADLKGKPIVFGARGSGLGVLARYVLEALGYDMARDFDAIFLDRVADAPAMVIDGRAAALWGGGRAWPAFTTVARAAGGARFIAPSASEIERILAQRPFLRRVMLPAESYPGQPQAITSVGSWNFILARPQLPEEAGYRFARALHAAEAVLGEANVQARETTLANTVAAVSDAAMLHPGVARYLREANLLR